MANLNAFFPPHTKDRATCRLDHIKVVVEVEREGAEMHVRRTVDGRLQHQFLRADIHDDARILAHAVGQYLTHCLTTGRDWTRF